MCPRSLWGQGGGERRLGIGRPQWELGPGYCSNNPPPTGHKRAPYAHPTSHAHFFFQAFSHQLPDFKRTNESQRLRKTVHFLSQPPKWQKKSKKQETVFFRFLIIPTIVPPANTLIPFFSWCYTLPCVRCIKWIPLSCTVSS